MNTLFSFDNKEILANEGETIKIFASSKFDTKITIKIESNVETLNGFYSANGEGPILQFVFEEETVLKATRLWGASWNFDGYLDCVVKPKSEIEMSKEVLATIKTSDDYNRRVSNQYNAKGVNSKGFVKKAHHLNKTDDNQYSIIVNNKIISQSSLAVSNNAVLTINKPDLNDDNDTIINIPIESLKSLGVLLQVKINDDIYSIPGQEIDNESNLDSLVRQLKWMLNENEITNLYFYQLASSLYVKRNDKHIKKIQLIGALHTLQYSYDVKRSTTSELIIQHIPPVSQWNKDAIILSINDSNIKHNKCVLNITNHQTPNLKLYSTYYDNICHVILELDESVSTDTEWILINDSAFVYYNIQTLNANELELHWYIKLDRNFKDTLKLRCKSRLGTALTELEVKEKTKDDKFYYKVNSNRSGATIKLYSNQKVEDTQYFTIDTLSSSKSKEHIDFKIQQSSFKILEGEQEKKIKLKWLNKMNYQECSLKINDIIIPVKYINTEYYPTSFNVVESTHILNRVVNESLTLKYFDKNTSGTLVLQPRQSKFSYFPTGDEVIWQLYDGKYKLWEKTVFYNIYKNELDIVCPEKVKYNSTFKIKFKLKRKYTKPIKFKIISESNIGLKLNDVYEIRINDSYTEISLKSNRKKSIGWLAFRVESLNNDIDIDYKKHLILFE